MDVNNCRTPTTAENANHRMNAKDGRGTSHSRHANIKRDSSNGGYWEQKGCTAFRL